MRHYTLLLCISSTIYAAQTASALLCATINGCTPIVQQLVTQSTSDINVQDAAGNTAIHYAVRHHLHDITDILRQAGADPAHANSSGQTPLHIAVQSTNIKAIHQLLAQNCPINAQDADGNTAMHLAASYAHRAHGKKILKVLLQAEPNLQITNNNNLQAKQLLDKQASRAQSRTKQKRERKRIRHAQLMLTQADGGSHAS